MTAYSTALKEWRRAYLQAALAQYGSVRAAALAIGVNRSWFYAQGVMPSNRKPWPHNRQWRELRV